MTPDQIAELLACEYCAYDDLHHWRRIVTPSARQSWEMSARQAMDRIKAAAVLLSGEKVGRAALIRLMRERVDDLAKEVTGIEINKRPAEWPAYLESLSPYGFVTGESERSYIARRLQDKTKDNRRYITKLDRILTHAADQPAPAPNNLDQRAA